MEAKILFLDDMGWRHSEFTRITDEIDRVRVWQAQTAAGAIALLNSQKFDQVFLDHDLTEDDVMCALGQQTRAPTGMDVVDHILTMQSPPAEVIVHSCNGPAAEEMVKRLETHPAKIVVRRVPFPTLVELMRESLRRGTI